MTRPDHGDAAPAAGWHATDEVATPPRSAYHHDPVGQLEPALPTPPIPPGAPAPPKFVPPPWHAAPARPSPPVPPPVRTHPAPHPQPPYPPPPQAPSPQAPSPQAPSPQAPAGPTRRRGLRRGAGRQPADVAPPDHSPYGPDGTLLAPESFDARLAFTQGATGVPGRDFVVEDGTVEPTDQKKARKKRRSRLSGGRWKRQALLSAMVVALLVLILNGAYRLAGKALYEPPTPPPGAGFPVGAASGYATRFAFAYLNWDENNPATRAQELRLFFPNPFEMQLGWDGRGVQRVIGQPVASGVTARDDQRAVVHVAAFLDPGGWTCMDVAVFTPDGGRAFAITSYAAFVACPPVAAASVPLESREADSQLAEALRPTLDTFFKAYAASAPELTQVITEDSGIFGLRGIVGFIDITSLVVPVAEKGADPALRIADAKVRWRTVSGGLVVQAYRLTLRQIGGRWFVHKVEGGVESSDIAPAQGGMAPPPSGRPSADRSGGPSAGPSGSANPSASPSG